MNNPKEIQCAQLAWAAQVRMHERILGASYSQQFDSPLSGVSLLPEDYRGIKQLLLLPIAWVMILFLAVLLPFAYVAHRIELHKTRTALRQKIRMPFNAAVYEAPTVKTIDALWDACDPPNRVGLQESTKLVDDWLGPVAVWL